MQKQTRVKLIIGILLPLLLLTAYWYSASGPTNNTEVSAERVESLIRAHSPTAGNENAKVILVEFMDPACGTCQRFHPFVKELLAFHAGKVKLVVRYVPFHKGSVYMVKLLEAAKKQDKFWPVLDVIFEHQQEWASHNNPQPELIWKYLGGLGLDIERLKKDMQDPAIEQVMQQDLADAATLGVKKTPDFFVNAQPLTEFGFIELGDLVQDEVNRIY